MAKKIKLSADGNTWYVLPGNSGELNNEAGDIDDTIFGQNFQSGQTGLIGGVLNANGLYKGFAGYLAELKKSGSTTAFTDEAMTLVSGKTFKITDATKNCWDRTVTPTFTDNAVAVPSNEIESIDYLFGRVTFTSGHSVVGPIVAATGSYLPLTQVAKGQSFTLTQTANAVENTDFETAQGNNGTRTYQYGLKQVALEIQGVYASSNAFLALLKARSEMIVEINPDGSDKSSARGFFKPMSDNQSGDVGALEQESLNLTLSVPDQESVVTPFKWIHASNTTLNQAIQKALDAWQNETDLYVQYLPDGTNGKEGSGVVTDISLQGGLEVMNEFTVNVQLSDELVDVP